MKLVTLRRAGGTRAARVEGDAVVELDASDVGELLRKADWRERALASGGRRHLLAGCDLAPVVPRPSKIICVGLNYRGHIAEMGRDLPRHPTLFAKFSDALVGAEDPVLLDGTSVAVDWEAELAVVIGRSVRHADDAAAQTAIAGFSALNDVTMRDWQYRTSQWLQGKTFEASTPFGPVLVTPDDLPGGTRPCLAIQASVDGHLVQQANTGDLVFDPVALVRYISAFITLRPGDVIATGTPGGVGHAQTPPRYLTDGSVLTTEIEGIGRLRNAVRTASPHPAEQATRLPRSGVTP